VDPIRHEYFANSAYRDSLFGRELSSTSELECRTTQDRSTQRHDTTWFRYSSNQCNVVTVARTVGDEQVLTAEISYQCTFPQAIEESDSGPNDVANQEILVVAQRKTVDQTNAEFAVEGQVPANEQLGTADPGERLARA
jgi:hypothetical protein